MNGQPGLRHDAAANPTGVAFGDPVPETFPKADPYCYQGAATGSERSIVPPPLCGTDWMPYSRNFNETRRWRAPGSTVRESWRTLWR